MASTSRLSDFTKFIKIAKSMLDACRLRIRRTGLELSDRRMDAVERPLPLSELRIVWRCDVNHCVLRIEARLLVETTLRSIGHLVSFYLAVSLR